MVPTRHQAEPAADPGLAVGSSPGRAPGGLVTTGARMFRELAPVSGPRRPADVDSRPPSWHLDRMSTPSSPPSDQPARARMARRLLGLLACLAAGLGVGLAGEALTGNQVWYLAIPAVVALGWLVVANPAECQRGGCALGTSTRPPRGHG